MTDDDSSCAEATFAGIPTSRGFVSGPVFLHAGRRSASVPEYVLDPEDVPAEIARYERARIEARRQLEELLRTVPEDLENELQIFTNHLVILDDELIVGAIRKRITEERLNSEAAITRSVAEFRRAFLRMDDPYLRERVRDIDDIERRVLGILTGAEDRSFVEITSPVIIVANDLTPSDTVSIPRKNVLGFATEGGSATSHVALLARALGIPAVTGVKDVTLHVRSGDKALLDGTSGVLTVNPKRETREQFAELIVRERRLLESFGGADTRAPDGMDVRFYANVQPGVPVEKLLRAGAVGVGLYRTEYLWLEKGCEPTEQEQFEAYRAVIEETSRLGPNARTVFRILDIGGDKVVKGAVRKEENPFLGCRSIRYLLANREILRTQLRAILRASAYGNAAVMYPMVATIEELRETNRELTFVKDQLMDEETPFDGLIPRGMMVEIPSAALNAGVFAQEVDFFSIGTNDLVQYTMAADRGNPDVANLYQPTNPAIVKLVDMTCRAADAAGIPVSVCGESASDPVTGLLWASLGVKGLSMNAVYIPAVRKALASFKRAEAEALAEEVRALALTRGAAEIYSAVKRRLAEKLPDLDEIQSFFAPVGAES